jgi:hypothetical protein
VVDLRRRIKGYAVLPLHEPGDRLLERRRAVVGVAAVFGLAELLDQGAADALVGDAVVLADAEVEKLPLGMLGEGLAFGALDLLELVDGGGLAVLGAADAVGEQTLEVGVGPGERTEVRGQRSEVKGDSEGFCRGMRFLAT